MRKASSVKTPWNDGIYSRRVVERAAKDATIEPFDTSGWTTVKLPTAAARGAGKMAPRGGNRHHGGKVVGVSTKEPRIGR